jgi:hypothetical protein
VLLPGNHDQGIAPGSHPHKMVLSNASSPMKKSQIMPGMMMGQSIAMQPEIEYDHEFFSMANATDILPDQLASAMENFEEVGFDSFNYCQQMGDCSMPYMVHLLFQRHDFYNRFFVSMHTCFNFSSKISSGYWKVQRQNFFQSVSVSAHSSGHLHQLLQGE